MKQNRARSKAGLQPARRDQSAERGLPSWLALAMLGAGAASLFLEVLLGRRWLWDDVLYFYYPYHYYLFACLRGLSLPMWNPYVFAGMPFLADVQSGVFYPVNWLLAALSSPDRAWVYWLVELKVVLHVFGAAAFAFLLGRELRLSQPAALVAGMVYGLGGFFVTHTVHVSFVSTLTWLPLVLLLEIRSAERHSLKPAASAGLALGTACLAGHPQAAAMIAYAVVLHRTWAVGTAWRVERHRIVGHLLGLCVLLGIGLLVSAPAFLPALDNARWTVRAVMGWSDAAAGALPPTLPLLLFVPKFFGSIAGGINDTVRYWGGGQRFLYWETCIYAGILPLVLAIGAALGRDRRRLFFAVLGASALLLALGRLTPLHWLAYKLLPGFRLFRVPARLGAVFALSVGVLAGYGLDILKSEPWRARRWLHFGLAFAVVCALGFGLLASGALNSLGDGMAQPELYSNAVRQSAVALGLVIVSVGMLWLLSRGRRFGVAFAVGLVALDLGVFGWNFSRGTIAPGEYYAENSIVRRLRVAAEEKTFRVDSRSGDVTLLRANQGMLEGVELLDGFSPLRLADHAALDRLDPKRRADLLNAEWRVNVDHERGVMTVDTNPRALPRARVFGQWVVLPERDTVLAWLSDPMYDLHSVVLLQAEPGIAARFGGRDSVAVTERTADRMRLVVEADSGGLLLLSEMYHPRWRARINGRYVPVLRANGALRAVALSPGRSEIEFFYDTRLVRLATALSILGLLLGLGLALGRRLDKPVRQASIGQNLGGSPP